MWAGGSPPTGWQICYGQALSRTTYSELFAVIGTDYGSGDGSTTFNAPNFEGRVPVGVDFTQGEFEPMGKTGGSKTHQLTTAEMPAHVHSNRAVNWNVTPAGSGTYAAFNSAVAQNSEDTGSTGGGGHHNNLQPYLTVRFIIKT